MDGQGALCMALTAGQPLWLGDSPQIAHPFWSSPFARQTLPGLMPVWEVDKKELGETNQGLKTGGGGLTSCAWEIRGSLLEEGTAEQVLRGGNHRGTSEMGHTQGPKARDGRR